MKTIEERAEERTQESDVWFEKTSYEFGYIEGATDQQAIDINKACEWLKNNFEGGKYVQDWQIEEFVKAMKEE